VFFAIVLLQVNRLSVFKLSPRRATAMWRCVDQEALGEGNFKKISKNIFWQNLQMHINVSMLRSVNVGVKYANVRKSIVNDVN
jgi:hypothetical protein